MCGWRRNGWASEWDGSVTDDNEWDYQSTRLPHRVSAPLGASPRLRSPLNVLSRTGRSPQSRCGWCHAPALSPRHQSRAWKAPQPLLGASPWGRWSPPQPPGLMWSWLSYWNTCARCPGGFPSSRPAYWAAAPHPRHQQGGTSCRKALSGTGTQRNTQTLVVSYKVDRPGGKEWNGNEGG